MLLTTNVDVLGGSLNTSVNNSNNHDITVSKTNIPYIRGPVRLIINTEFFEDKTTDTGR